MNNNVLIKNGKILTPNSVVEGSLLIKNGKISGIFKKEVDIEPKEDFAVIDAMGRLVLPGFIDIHTHGGAGVDINYASKEEFKALNKFYASKGVTSYLPTIAGDTHENTKKAVEQISLAKNSGINGSEIIGIHLEGPYLCGRFKGAIPEEVFRDPDFNDIVEYQKISGNLIRHITMAPERDNAVNFVREIKEKMPEISLSLGHTGATYEEAMDVIENGLNHVTHTFNAIEMMHHRTPGVMGAAFDSDITVEIIPDGKHTHPAMIRILLKIKGIEKLVAVTDSATPTGLPDGDYTLGRNKIKLVDGDLWVSGLEGVRAGSVLTMIEGYKNLMKFTKLSKEDASLLVSRNPAEVIGYNHKKGIIRPGYDGDVIIVDEEYNVKNTFVKGIMVYEN